MRSSELTAPSRLKLATCGSAFHKAMAQDAVQLMPVTGTKGWVAGLSKALQAAGYAFQPQHLQGNDIGRLQALLTDGRQRVWDDLDFCPRTAPSRGARKCMYERWFRKPSWAGASPLTLPLTHAAMQRFLRFRTGCHGLPKDIGSQSGVPRHQRVCQLCGTGFGDEMHLVFECAAMADLRGQFPYLSATSDDAAIHVAAKSVAGCQILRCRHEKIADG